MPDEAHDVERHLDQGVLERLLSAGTTDTELPQDVMRHLDSCDECRRRLLLTGINLPDNGEAPGTTVEPCPSDRDLLYAARHVSSPAEVIQVMRHAVHCSSCAHKLRRYIEDLSTIPDNATAPPHLQSSTHTWQQKLAIKLAASQVVPPPAPTKKSWSGWVIAAILAAIAAAAWWLFRK